LSGELEIFTMRADGSHVTNLTRSMAFDVAPDWQPLARTSH
jgi:hypothetical protein